MSSPSTDWAQFYQHNASANPTGLFIGNQVSDTTTVATATATSASIGLSPEGRVSKPNRKRSRASRRTPTTLLNTDTANFRAMVQQFTGGPLAPFSSNTTSYPSGTNFSLGLGTGQQMASPNAVMVPRPAGYNVLQVQQQFQQQQQHEFMFSMNNSANDDHHHAYLRRLERSTVPQMGVSGGGGGGGFRVDGVSSSVHPIIRSSSSNKNLSEDNYML